MNNPSTPLTQSLLPHSESIGTFTNAKECASTIDYIHSSFRTEHDHKLDIELWFSATFKPEVKPDDDGSEHEYVFGGHARRRKRRKLNNDGGSDTDRYNLVVRCDNPTKHKYQIDWARQCVEAVQRGDINLNEVLLSK